MSEPGKECSRCSRYNTIGQWDRPWTCHQCRDIEKPDELYHDKFIRCPECGHVDSPEDWDSDTCRGWQCGDDFHLRSCPECGCDFQFETHTSYAFTSPEKVQLTDVGNSCPAD